MESLISARHARMRASAERLVWKNVRDRLRIRCLEAEAAREYSLLSHLVLPSCGRAPTRLPYGKAIDVIVGRVSETATRLDRMIRDGSADRGSLLAEEESLDTAFERLEELIDGRFELVGDCYPDEPSWERALLDDRVACLRRLLSSASTSANASSDGLVGEVLDIVRKGEDSVTYLLGEADTALGIVLLDRRERRYFGERTEGMFRDVGIDISDILRALPSESPKTASEIFGTVILFGVTEVRYRNGAILPEAAARNLFDIRSRLVRIYEDTLGGA